MVLDVKQAESALRTSGVPAKELCSLWWPFGRRRRALLLVRKRVSVLEAKNSVVDVLFRTQRALAQLDLNTVQQVEQALRHSEKHRLIAAVGMSRAVMEDELRSHCGTELGPALDSALSELVAEGVVLQVPGKAMLCDRDVYLASYRNGKPHYDVSRLSKLLTVSRGYGGELRARARRESSTGDSRSYKL